MAEYKYRLKSGSVLDPNQVYKVAKSGGASQCSYLWDSAGRCPGWIPASENFNWEGSHYVRELCLANQNIVYTIQSTSAAAQSFEQEWAKRQELYNYAAQNKELPAGSKLDKDLESLLVKDTTNEFFDSSDHYPPPTGTVQPARYTATRYPNVATRPADNITISILPKKETMLDNIIATNKAAAVQAAYLETGRIANATAANLLAKKFPGLPQTPFNALIIANLADVIGKQIKPSPKLAKITTAMVTQAYAEVYQLIDLEGMIGELLNTVPGFDDGE